MDPETWVLQRIHGKRKKLRHESEDVDYLEEPFWRMLRHESDTWILQRILRYEDAET